MKVINIGRSSSNDVCIDDRLVSRVHCQIIQDDNGDFTLIDTNSSNGTFVNGIKHHGEVKLNTSDIVRIGNTTLPWQTYFRNTPNSFENSGRTIIGNPLNNGGNNNINSININNINPKQSEPYREPVPGCKPNNFLVWAILSTLFCCLPFGIVSIVYASKVDGLWASGQYYEALAAASKARTWFWWSFGSALFIWLIYILFYGWVAISL